MDGSFERDFLCLSGLDMGENEYTATSATRSYAMAEFKRIAARRVKTEIPKLAIAERNFLGEPFTRDILSELEEKEEAPMDKGLERIKRVTIECENGATFEGTVKRIEGNPYFHESLEVTAEISKQKCGDYGIKKVLFQNPATIVYWTDGTKTVVNCMDNVETKKKTVNGKKVTVRKPRKCDTYSKEIGLAMAIAKKWAGNAGSYNNIFHKFAGTEE